MENSSFAAAQTKKPRTGKTTVLDMVYIALSAALIAVCSQISIPTEIPFTLQTLAVFITAGLLGTTRGSISVIVYILLGLVGVPVFANFSGGAGALFGMTGGYIIGFIFTALAVGLITRFFGKGIISLAVSMVIGLFLCYAFGTAWFMVVYGNSFGAISLMEALGLCVFPYLIFDAAKIAVSIVVVKVVSKYVRF